MNLFTFALRTMVVLSVIAIGGSSVADAAIVGSWDFEEASGSTVEDGVGNFDATIGAGTGSRVSTGDFGGALGKSWSSGTAEVSTGVYTNQYNALTSASIEGWIKWNGGGVASYWLNSPTFTNLIHTGVPGVRFIIGGVDSLYLPVETVTTNQWQHWVMSYNGASGTMRIYANGVEVYNEAGGTGLDWAALASDKIGLNNGGTFNDGTAAGGNFNGLVDRLRIHNVALTEAEALTLYNQIAIPEPASVALFAVSALTALGARRRPHAR